MMMIMIVNIKRVRINKRSILKAAYYDQICVSCKVATSSGCTNYYSYKGGGEEKEY